MGRKPKFTYEEKIYAVLEYLNGKNSLKGIAKVFDVQVSTIRKWVMIYNNGHKELKTT